MSIRKNRFAATIHIAVLFLLIIGIFKFLHKGIYQSLSGGKIVNPDLIQHYDAIREFKFNKRSPYYHFLEISDKGNRGSTAPLPFLMLVLPFSIYRYGTFEKIFFIMNFAVFIFALYGLFKISRFYNCNLEIFIFTLALILLYEPIYKTLNLGQTNIFVLASLIWSFYFFISDRNLLAGIALAVAFSVKITPGFVMLFFIIRKDLKAVAGFLIAFIILFSLSTAVFSVEALKDFVYKVLPRYSKGIYTCWYYNQNLKAFLYRLFVANRFSYTPVYENKILADIIYYGGIIFFICLSVFFTFKTNSKVIGFGLFVVTYLIISPLTWIHYYSVLVFVYSIVIYYIHTKRTLLLPTITCFCSYALTWYYFPGVQILKKFPGTLFVSLKFYGLILIYITFSLIAIEREKHESFV